MPEAALLLVVLVVGIGVGGGLLLYAAVRAEGRHRETTNRTDAERAARLDAGDPEASEGESGSDE